jgi:hypothetical protein
MELNDVTSTAYLIGRLKITIRDMKSNDLLVFTR